MTPRGRESLPKVTLPLTGRAGRYSTAGTGGRAQVGVLRGWQARHWAAALGGAGLAAVLVGVPTGIIRTSLYRRMTPVLWWNYPVWAATALLEGFLLASYVRAGSGKASTGRATAGGVLSFLAVGCPVCNKLIVLAIGVSGALSYWAPVQPFLAAASLALLGFAVRRRLRGLQSCPVP